MIIGLSGYGRSGKNTVAEILRDNWGFEVVAFADVLREACRALNPIVGVVDFPADPIVRWAELYDEYGYEGAKDHPTLGTEFRRIMLNLGTEVGRDILGQDVWVDALGARLLQRPGENFAIADMRFPNEAKFVHNYTRTGHTGITVRVDRPGFGAVADHPSETSLEGWSFTYRLLNNGTLEDLTEKVTDMVNTLVEAGYLTLSK